MTDALESFAASLDPVAARRWTQWQQGQSSSPWLHDEIAERLLERLALMQLPAISHWANWNYPYGGVSLQRSLSTRWATASCYAPGLTPSAVASAPSPAKKRPWLHTLFQRSHDAAEPLALAPPPDSCQLLLSNMGLHHSANLPQTLKQWQQSLSIGGMVLFSTLGPDSLLPLQRIYQRLGWPAPMQRLIDMHDLGDALVSSGLDTPVMEMEVLTLSYSSPAALLAELRTLGRNLHPERFASWRGRRWLAQLHAELEQLRQPDGRIHLPFEIIYGHAFKPAPKAQISISKRKQLMGD